MFSKLYISFHSNGDKSCNFFLFFSDSTDPCGDEVATVASNTFIFGSKTSLNGFPVRNSTEVRGVKKSNTITEKLESRRRTAGFQSERKKNVNHNKGVPNNRVRSPIPRSSSSSSSFGGSVLSQANKPWFIATRDPSSLIDEMKEMNPINFKEGDDKQLDKDVLY